MLATACGRQERNGEAALAWQLAPSALPALPDKLVLKDGLVARPFAAEPMLVDPVAFDVDARGRVFVVETHRYLRSVFDITQQPAWLRSDLSFRTEQDRRDFLLKEFAADPGLLRADSETLRVILDDDGDGRADRSAVYAKGFDDVTAGTAASVLAAGDHLWFACVPDLWRLPLPDRLEHEARAESIAHGFGVHIGVTGHDLHGLTLGPDGRIWFTVGDRGAHLTTREGVVIDLPDTGAVYRCEQDGSDLQVFATGLRNPQEIAFDDLGNLFTDDNDTAGADRSRVLYLVDGGDYGWRCAYQHAPGFGPWVQEKVWEGGIDGVLPTAGFAAQGPAGLACYPGTGFSHDEDGRMFVCDFPGGVLSFGLEARGAGFKVTDVHRVAWSLWPTDVCFGPDGALWVLDWVAGWQRPEKGRIHRLFDEGVMQSDLVRQTRELLRDGMHARSESELAGLLGHADRRVRTAAHLELATRGARGVQTLVDVLHSGEVLRPRLHALWGIGVAVRRGDRGPESTLVDALDDRDREIRAQAARLCGELGVTAASERLGILVGDGFPREQFFAAIALGKLRAVRWSSRVLAMLQAHADGDAFLVHAGVQALRSLLSEKELAVLAQDPEPAVRRAGMLALAREASPEIAVYLDDASERIRIEAARAIHDRPIAAAAAALADRATDTTLDAASRSRAIDCALRLGRSADANALAELAADERMPSARRAQALDALAHFAAPDPIDVVTGAWRALAPRDGTPARQAFATVAARVASTTDEAVLGAFVRASLALDAPGSGPLLAAIAGREGPAALRIAALKGCAQAREGVDLRALVEHLLDDADADVRRAAIALLPRCGSTDALARLTPLATGSSDPSTRRVAIHALGELGEPSEAVLGAMLGRLDDLPSALRLDVLDAAQASGSPSLAAALAARDAALPRDDRLARDRVCLDGGDPAQGRRIFEERQDVSCVRCHAVAGVGGTVGPSLDGLAKRSTPDEILESVLYPMARIKDGYPPAMPDVAMRALSRSELRDLIAWLRSLK